jgi:hypothetical protein
VRPSPALPDDHPSAAAAFDAGAEEEPDVQPSNGDVQAKEEIASTSFVDGTVFEPIDVDEPVDASVLEDFAMFWEFNIQNDDGNNVDPEGHAIYVLRSSVSSQDVPGLMDENSGGHGHQTLSGSMDMEADNVTSNEVIGV